MSLWATRAQERNRLSCLPGLKLEILTWLYQGNLDESPELTRAGLCTNSPVEGKRAHRRLYPNSEKYACQVAMHAMKKLRKEQGRRPTAIAASSDTGIDLSKMPAVLD